MATVPDSRATIKLSRQTEARILAARAYPNETRESIIVRALEALERSKAAIRRAG